MLKKYNRKLIHNVPKLVYPNKISVKIENDKKKEERQKEIEAELKDRSLFENKEVTVE